MTKTPVHSQIALATLVDLLQVRAQEQPDRRTFTFLLDGERDEASLTNAHLAQRVYALAARLQQHATVGDRALLLLPPGLDYVVGFFACLHAGVVAVPAYPPQPNRIERALPKLRAFASSAEPAVVLTTSSLSASCHAPLSTQPGFGGAQWIAVDQVEDDAASAWRQPALRPDTLAFLQYTSGSTSSPKGVMLTHANLLHNSGLCQRVFDHTPDSKGVAWLPPYHDMGLIGGIVQPLYVGASVVLMSPVAFLQRPMRWLEAISRYRGTSTTAPNFAYDLCVRSSRPEQRLELDLSSWKVAVTGAEPVWHETLDRFAEAFEPSGFRRAAFCPAYGLAEATLLVSGGMPALVQTFEADSLVPGQVATPTNGADDTRTLVGSGPSLSAGALRIADPDTYHEATPGQVGEVWVQGPSVASGYWNKPEETQAVFGARLAPSGEGPFLRTGDLGFLFQDQLFITGRLKDLIIVRGQNHYPQDLERTVALSHPAVRPDAGAAFSVEAEGEERLVIVQEVERQARTADPAPIVGAIRKALAEQHEVHADGVVLIRTGSIPKTTSRKVQRYACRDAFLNGSLTIVHVSLDRALARLSQPAATHATSATDSTAFEQVRAMLADVVGMDAADLDPRAPMSQLGLDSLRAVRMRSDLEERYGLTIGPDTFAEDVTLAEVASYVENAHTSSRNGKVSAQHSRLESAQNPVAAPGRNGHSASGPPRKAQSDSQPALDLEARHSLGIPTGRNVLDRARQTTLADEMRQAGLMPYFRELVRNEGPTCVFEDRQVIMLGSNNYLGLTTDRRVREAAARAALEEGPSLTGSRLLNGSTVQHRAFEQKIAAFLGREDGLVFTTGYQANIGLLSAFMVEGTVLILDDECHASIYDGAAVGRTRLVQFKHNDLADLERKLDRYAGSAPGMVMVDGVYSMSGDVARLPEVRALCARYEVPLTIDDAHGLGVLGATGRGTEEHFDLLGTADIVVGTFSKSLASIGGWVVGEARVIDWIRFFGRSMIFSAAIPPTSLAAASAALDILVEEPWRVQRLHENASYWREGLQARGFNTAASATPIVPVVVGDDLTCLQFGKALLEAGVYVNAAVAPAVPRGSALMRTSVMATHAQHHLDQALDVFERVGKALRIVG